MHDAITISIAVHQSFAVPVHVALSQRLYVIVSESNLI